MADERFSLRDSELDLPRYEERVSASWAHARARLDPSPRDEIAKVFFKDSMRAALKIH